MELIENLKNDFTEIFNENPTNIYFSPGRVNLIGEHTDYNGGNVFPCALSIGTYGLTTKRDDKKVRLYSNNFKDIGVIEFDLDQLKFEKEHDWANYPKGVIKTFKDHGFDISNGFNVLIY